MEISHEISTDILDEEVNIKMTVRELIVISKLFGISNESDMEHSIKSSGLDKKYKNPKLYEEVSLGIYETTQEALDYIGVNSNGLL